MFILIEIGLLIAAITVIYVTLRYETIRNKYVLCKLKNFKYDKDDYIGKIYLKGIYYTVKYVDENEVSIGDRIYPTDIINLSYNKILEKINDNESSFYEKLFQIIAMQD